MVGDLEFRLELSDAVLLRRELERKEAIHTLTQGREKLDILTWVGSKQRTVPSGEIVEFEIRVVVLVVRRVIHLAGVGIDVEAMDTVREPIDKPSYIVIAQDGEMKRGTVCLEAGLLWMYCQSRKSVSSLGKLEYGGTGDLQSLQSDDLVLGGATKSDLNAVLESLAVKLRRARTPA